MAHYWQREYIKKNSTQTSNTQEWSIELPETGLLSALDIQMRVTNGSTSNQDNPLDYNIKKVEVVGDGSTVICSLEGRELRKLNMFDANGADGLIYNENASAYQYIYLRVPFGRYLYDNDYGLDCGKWSSIDLKLDYDLTRTRAVSSTTAHVSGSAQFNVIGYRKTGAYTAPKGFLKTSEVNEYTSVGGSVEKRIELPRKHLYHRCMIHAYEAGVADGTDITYVEVDLEEGGKIPFKANWADLQRENQQDYGIHNTFKGLLFKSNSDTTDTLLGRIIHADARGMQDLSTATTDLYYDSVRSVSGDRITINSVTRESSGTWAAASSNTTDHTIYLTATGEGVGNCVMIPLGQLGNGFVFDSKTVSKTEVVLTDAAAGATVRTILQEIVEKQGE